MNIDGRCHCGYITFEADADPDKAAICHCTDCQSFSGFALRNKSGGATLGVRSCFRPVRRNAVN